MADLLWTPVDPVLIDESETAKNILKTITVSVDSGADPGSGGSTSTLTINELSYVLDPLIPDGMFSVAVDGMSINVSAESLAGLFGFSLVEYRSDDVIYQAYKWDDIPSTNADIIKYEPLSLSSKDFSLVVTAKMSDNSTSSKSYTIRINQNWTTGKDKFLEVLNASRSKIR